MFNITTVMMIGVAFTLSVWAIRASVQVRRFYSERRLVTPQLTPSILSPIWHLGLDGERKAAAQGLRRKAIILIVGAPLLVSLTLLLWASVNPGLFCGDTFKKMVIRYMDQIGMAVSAALPIAVFLNSVIIVLWIVILRVNRSMRSFYRLRGRHPVWYDSLFWDIWARDFTCEDKMFARRRGRTLLWLLVVAHVMIAPTFLFWLIVFACL